MRLLVDGDVLAHKAVAEGRTEVQWSDDVYSLTLDVGRAADYAATTMARWVAEHRADGLTLAFSDPTRRYFRHDVWPAYKANRSRMVPGWDALVSRMSALAPTVCWRHLEADDVLGVLATQPGSDGDVVVSIDKDMLGVPGRHWNPDREELGVRVVSEDGADRWHLTQTLVGDRVDGYPGCPGVGPVKAARLLEDPSWDAVVGAYEKAGRTADDALAQARLARLLRHGEYDPKTNEVTLWTPR